MIYYQSSRKCTTSSKNLVPNHLIRVIPNRGTMKTCEWRMDMTEAIDKKAEAFADRLLDGIKNGECVNKLLEAELWYNEQLPLS